MTILLTSHPDQPLVRESSVIDQNKLLKDIEALTPADSACEWPVIFKQLDDYISGAAHLQKELILITDLRRSGWSAGVSAQTAHWGGQSFDFKIVRCPDRAVRRTRR